MESDASPSHHLKRLSSVWTEREIYFLTCCAASRRPVLACEVAHEILREEWESARQRHGWQIGRYVLMPDDVHFFASSNEESKSLSAFMRHWKEWTSKRLLKQLGLQAPLWQKEFFDHLLRNDESGSDKWDYVYHNPVRTGLTTKPEYYRFAGSIHFE